MGRANVYYQQRVLVDFVFGRACVFIAVYFHATKIQIYCRSGIVRALRSWLFGVELIDVI